MLLLAVLLNRLKLDAPCSLGVLSRLTLAPLRALQSWLLAPTPAAGALPPHWQQAADPEGRTYYFHRLTNETSWERPSDPAVPLDVAFPKDADSLRAFASQLQTCTDHLPEKYNVINKKIEDLVTDV